jgi:hypothetical protein
MKVPLVNDAVTVNALIAPATPIVPPFSSVTLLVVLEPLIKVGSKNCFFYFDLKKIGEPVKRFSKNQY